MGVDARELGTLLVSEAFNILDSLFFSLFTKYLPPIVGSCEVMTSCSPLSSHSQASCHHPKLYHVKRCLIVIAGTPPYALCCRLLCTYFRHFVSDNSLDLVLKAMEQCSTSCTTVPQCLPSFSPGLDVGCACCSGAHIDHTHRLMRSPFWLSEPSPGGILCISSIKWNLVV